MSSPSVFISYSHADEKEKNALLLHLGVLRGAGLIDLWSDDRIGGGSDWEAEIDEAMASARIAILLISANFLTSEFITRKEVPTILKYREAKGLVTFPVIARPCAWQKVEWLRKLNVRPKNGVPVWHNEGKDAEEELTKIAYEIADIVAAGFEKEGHQKPASVPSTRELRLFLVTDDGKRYETIVSSNLQVAQLVDDFVAECPPPEHGGFVRHSLKLQRDGRSLDNTLTLAEAGISNDMSLYLVEEKVVPTSSVGLIVEDAEGHRFVTNVFMNTPVKRLATEFMNNLGKPAAQPTVELLGRLAGQGGHRVLRGESTLFEERVQNGARLRILAGS
jgi:hypothetical protein